MWPVRAAGALVCWWLSNCRCWDYISRRCSNRRRRRSPPQTIISLPVHTAVCPDRAFGALVVLVAVQLSVLGLYLPPVLKRCRRHIRPRQSFRCSVHTAVCASRIGRIGGAGGCPTVGAGIISSAGVQIAAGVVTSAPDDHFTVGPHCRVTDSASGRVGGAGGCPTVGAGIISAAGVQTAEAVIRPRRSFRCQSTLLCDLLGQRARWRCWWLSNYRCWDYIFRRC